jgi:glutamine amidotransferase
MSKIAIIDYGMGNLNSVRKILQRIGVDVKIVSDGSQLENSEKIILPGVGHFKKAVENLKQRGFWDTLNLAVLGKKVPILGICLGMQLMAKHSEEGDSAGFGWFDAEVVRFRVNNSLKYKIPHIGWNHVSVKKANQLFDNVDLSSGFYFVHSYYIVCNNQFDVLNETVYESPFVTAIQRDNIYGVQYHPEKSHNAGEQLLRNFIKL